jgi:hypothetical protein
MSDNRYSVYSLPALAAGPALDVLSSKGMDFGEFERLVLRVLFETNVPLTAAHIAYLGGISVRTAERHLARMAEEGSLLLRANGDGQVEYYFPGRRALGPNPAGDEAATVAADAFRQQANNPLTAVLLSMLIPGAGHIYAGRAGVGVAWMASTLAGYACFFLPGLFLHGLCMVSAAHQRQS